LDNVLLNKVKSILRNETGLGKENVSTTEIYDKLTAAGVEVPELAIAEILEKLVKEQLITIVPLVDREGQEKHGAFMITWVSGKL
jgi:N-dimethylarginine dimethylaminohydrolase